MAQYFTVHPTDPQPRLIRLAAQIVRDGGVIAYPTDSSYALGCQVGNTDAARRMLAIRGARRRALPDAGVPRPRARGPLRAARQLAVPDRPAGDSRGVHVHPAGHARGAQARCRTRKRHTVGIRVPEHPVVRALLAELGEPILSSTLILPGDAAPLNEPDLIREALEARIELVIDAGPCADVPTTVVDLSSEPGVVVRPAGGDPARLGLA